MKTLSVQGYEIGLSAVYGEYNCGNKTVGRLKLVAKKPGSNTDEGESVVHDALQDPKIKEAVIKNYLLDMEDYRTFGKLNAGSPMFPTDNGVYRPGVLIYADSISYNPSYEWYNHWKALIAEFETNPKYGVVVLKSPILPNRYYGASRPSRVWTIVLPSIAADICYDKKSVREDMKSSLKQMKGCEGMPKHWKQELTSLGA